MKCCYIDIHIHTSENANELNKNFDIDKLEKKIKDYSKNNDYLISLTDHNIINIDAYKKMYNKKMSSL